MLTQQIEILRKEIFVNELRFNIKDEFDGDETNYIHCCLYEKDDLIAYARVSVECGKARIGRVAVRKDRRNNGYGRKIMFWAETEALKADIYQVYVHSLINKVDFYKKLGYQSVGESFIEDEHEHVK